MMLFPEKYTTKSFNILFQAEKRNHYYIFIYYLKNFLLLERKCRIFEKIR